jgi:tryptophanyl-tRNA synthetase
MSLRDGTKKMSKSDESDFSRINMTDDADTIALKIRRAKTDSLPMPATIEEAAMRPEAANLLGIYAALTDETMETVVAHFAGRNFSDFKPALSERAVTILGRVGGEMKRMLADPSHIDAVLRRGAARAEAMAVENLHLVFDMMGLLRP